MKEVFLVHITLPEVFTAAFYELLNSQRDRVNHLMENHILLSYSLDMERKYIWAFFETSGEGELKAILGSLPVIAHVHYTIHELAYYNAAPVSLPELIMN
jgi:hypothetical protein